MVDVSVAWDGDADIVGIFTSTEWDPTELELQTADFLGMSFFAPSLFEGPAPNEPGLMRLAPDDLHAPIDDPTRTVRSVQYARADPDIPVSTNAAGMKLVTTLTFRVVGVGDGLAEIAGTLLQGDVVFDDIVEFGDPATVSIIPEPSVGVLQGLGMSLLALGRRSRTSLAEKSRVQVAPR